MAREAREAREQGATTPTLPVPGAAGLYYMRPVPGMVGLYFVRRVYKPPMPSNMMPPPDDDTAVVPRSSPCRGRKLKPLPNDGDESPRPAVD